MKARRIVLSDDEDDIDLQQGESRGIGTPASSTEFLRDLSSLNMRSGSRTGEPQASSGPRTAAAPFHVSSVKKSGIADDSGEEDCFGSANELDPETIIRTMQGTNAEQTQEGESYEAMIQPVRASKSLYFSPAEAPRIRSSERSGSSRKDSQHRPERAMPRRHAAIRAQQKLQSIYSEYGEQSAGGRADDDSYGEENGDQQSGSSGQDNSDQPDEVGSEDFVVEDHDSDVPRHSRRRKDSRTSNHSSSDKNRPRRDGSSKAASAESPRESRESTRRSARSASLSARKQEQYLRAHRDIQLKGRSGLDAVLLGSSDEEVSGQHSDDDTEHARSHRRASSPPYKASSSQTRGASSSSQRRQSRDYDSSPPESPARRDRSNSGSKKDPKTQYSYSVSQIKSPAKCVGLMYRNDERGEREVDEDSGSDIDDFIVNSEEERAEEEARAQEAAYRKELRKQQRREEKQRRNQGNAKHTGQKAADIVASATATYNRDARAQASSSSAGGACAASMRDEDSEDGEVVLINSRSHRRGSSGGGADQGRQSSIGFSFDAFVTCFWLM